MKKSYIVLITTLCGWFCLYAQQQGSFYYYRGEPISLPVNNQRFFV